MDKSLSSLQELEKENRILQKKLARSEADRERLETHLSRTESLLKKVITDLQQSKQSLEVRSRELEDTLHQLQKTQSQLIESEKMSALGVLVAGVAHEINNPINFVHGNLNYAQDYLRDLLKLVSCYQQAYPEPVPLVQACMEDIEFDFLAEDLHKLLQSMQTGTERILEIVQSLKTFSRLDEADFKAANLHDGLESTLMILQNRLKPRGSFPGIDIQREYSLLPAVYCYPGKLNQVFMNLLQNAIDALEEAWFRPRQGASQFGHEQPKIRIKTSVEQDQIAIQIADNGLGISEEIRSRLFEPFFTTKPVGKGTGLGLSISYQIVVEQHQGQLFYHSQSGRGTEFVMMIPLADQSAETAASMKPRFKSGLSTVADASPD